MQKKNWKTRIHFTSAFFDAIAFVDAKKLKNPFWFYPGRWYTPHASLTSHGNGREPKLVPGALSLSSRKKNRIKKSKSPGRRWSRGSQNLGAKSKRGEEEKIIVTMTKVTLSRPEGSLPPRLLSADGPRFENVNNTRKNRNASSKRENAGNEPRVASAN